MSTIAPRTTGSSESPTTRALKRFRKNRLAMLSLGYVALVTLVSLVAFFWTPQNPYEINKGQGFRPPSWSTNTADAAAHPDQPNHFLMGSDELDIRRSQHVRDQEARVLERAESPVDHDVAAALEGGRVRLLENDVSDAEQRRHHGDAEPEPARQHQRANRTGGQRSQREPQNHVETTRPLFITRCRPARAATTGL